MRERITGSYHGRWFGRSLRGMFTTWGGVGSVVFAVGIPLVVAWWQGVPSDEIGPFVVVTALFLMGAFLLQLLLAPRQMEREQIATAESRLAAVTVETSPRGSAPDAIGRINAHLDQSRTIKTRLRRMPRDAPDEEWTPALRECVDWVSGVGSLVNELCVGKHHDYVTLRRSIPTTIRNAGRNEDGSPWVNGRGARWDVWISNGTTILLACIERIENRPNA